MRVPRPAMRPARRVGALLATVVLAARLASAPLGPPVVVAGGWILLPAPAQTVTDDVVTGTNPGTTGDGGAVAGPLTPAVSSVAPPAVRRSRGSRGVTRPGTAEQRRNTAIVVGVGRSMGLPDRALQIALATALQESGLRNLHYGDRDSQGLFQQRPSMGWGTPAQVTTPSYAARKFFHALVAVRGWQKMALTDAAQLVQRSATPRAYARWESLAAALLTDVTATSAPAAAPVPTVPVPAAPAPRAVSSPRLTAAQLRPLAATKPAVSTPVRLIRLPSRKVPPPIPAVLELVPARELRPARIPIRPAGPTPVATGSGPANEPASERALSLVPPSRHTPPIGPEPRTTTPVLTAETPVVISHPVLPVRRNAGTSSNAGLSGNSPRVGGSVSGVGQQLGFTHPLARDIEDFLTDLSTAGAAYQTIRAYRGDLIGLARHFYGQLSELSEHPIREYLAQLSGLAASTRKRKRAALASLCTWAMRQDRITVNPMDTIDTITVARPLPRPVVAGHIQKVFAAICTRYPRTAVALDRLRDRVLFETVHVCGASAAEVCGLYVEDLVLDGGEEQVQIRGKDGTVRTVRLADRGYVHLLTLYLSRAGYTRGPLFRASINGAGGPLSYDAAHHRWNRYRAAAGVDVTIHQLRRHRHRMTT